MANKKRKREWVPTHKWCLDYLEELISKRTPQSEWDARVMDTILYHFPSEYLRFRSKWEQLNIRKW
ncbi:hypothetical protein KUA24_106 [Vibrio phage HNL01]|nr:hypothetical protein KUA24_106 [Vibrio phage HNL01]